jgi:hypothetical protein
MITEFNANLYDIIAEQGQQFDEAISEAAYFALTQLGDQIYALEWANKYAALSTEAIAAA